MTQQALGVPVNQIVRPEVPTWVFLVALAVLATAGAVAIAMRQLLGSWPPISSAVALLAMVSLVVTLPIGTGFYTSLEGPPRVHVVNLPTEQVQQGLLGQFGVSVDAEHVSQIQGLAGQSASSLCAFSSTACTLRDGALLVPAATPAGQQIHCTVEATTTAPTIVDLDCRP